MLTKKRDKMVLAAASLAMFAGAAHAIPENPLGGLSCCADELPYVVLDTFDGADDGDAGWYREAPGDGEADVIEGGGTGEAEDAPNTSIKG